MVGSGRAGSGRVELAELASLRKARELMYRYMGKQNNWISRKLRVFEIWYIKGKIVYFYPRTHFRHEPARPDPTRPDPTRPWRSLMSNISKNIKCTKKNYQSNNLDTGDKFYVLKFQNAIYDSFRVIAFSVKPVFSIIFSVFLAYLFTESEF